MSTSVASLAAADKMTNEIFKAAITPKVSFANIDVLAKLFSNYDLGEILSRSPAHRPFGRGREDPGRAGLLRPGA